MALLESFEKTGNWLFRHRSYLPIPVLLVGSVMVIRTELYPSTFFLQETPFEIPYEMLCLVVSLFGLGIRVFTVGFTPKNTSGRNVSGQVADTLNTTGMYSMVRHPLYLGNFFMWFGVAMLTGNVLFLVAFILFYWLYYERIMFAEEQFLVRKFGKEYQEWANRTPAFIPAFRKYQRPSMKFNWKKVIKKEKNGVVSVFFIFTFFNVIGEWIEGRFDYDPFLLAMLAISILYYVCVKLLKKYTSVLNES